MKPFATAVLAAGLMTALPAHANLDLARKNSCMSCHTVDKKLVGPSYKEVAAKYKPDAAKALAVKIQKGGSGVWGPVPMPANAQVNDAEALKLATWVLSLK